MKRITLLLMSVLLYATSAWAIDVTVGPSTGTYYDSSGKANPTNGWGPTWKSTASASNGTTPLLTFTGQTGMNIHNGDIYSNQTYTLTAPTGYVIVSYTINGTATGADITITPTGGSGTTVTSGSSLGTPLAVNVNAKTTTFALSSSGDAHFESLALTVTVKANLPQLTTNTESPRYYSIKSYNRGGYLSSNGSGQDMTHVDFKDGSVWYFTAADGNTSGNAMNGVIAHCFDGTQMTTSWQTSETGGTVYILPNGVNENGFSISRTATISTNSCVDARKSETAVGDWDPRSNDWEGTTWVIEPTIPSGYYNFKGMDTSRNPYLYSNFVGKGGNDTYHHSPLSGTNGEIWKVTNNGSSLSIINGEGLPLTIGTTTYETLNIGSVAEGPDFYFTEAINLTKGNDTKLTTWTGHPDATDNHWTFEAADVSAGLYNVVIQGNANGYVTYNGQNAKNGGFFVAASITKDDITIHDITDYKTSVTIEGNTITIVYTHTINYTLTDANGATYSGTYIGAAGTTEPPLTGCVGYTLSDKVWDGTTFTATINFPMPVSSNGTDNWTYINSFENKSSFSISDGHCFYWHANDNGEDVNVHDGDVPTNIKENKVYTDNEKYKWAVYPAISDLNITFTIKNSYTGKYIFSNTDSHSHNKGAVTLSATGTPLTYNTSNTTGCGTIYTWYIPSTNRYLSVNSATETNITKALLGVYNTEHDGVSIGFYPPADFATLDANLLAACLAFMPYDALIGSEYGQYSGDTSADMRAAYLAATTTTALTEAQITSYTNTLENPSTKLTLNVPQAGDFLRIKASATNKEAYTTSSDLYLTSSNTQSDVNNNAYKDKRVGFVEGAANDNTTIFYYDGNYLTGFANGLQPVNNTDNQLQIGAVGASATKITFESIESTEAKAFRIEFNDGGCSLYTQSNSEVYFTDAADGNATDAHCRYFLEKVTTLPVTISAAGYATLYAPVALTIPEGVTAYVATVDNGSYLHLEEISGGIIPANTGVILKGVADTYNFGITTGGSAEGNVLTGTVAAIARLSGSYILSNGANGVGFYKDGAQTIPGFKSYLAAKDAQGVRGFLGFNFDDPTAISVIEAAMNAGKTIYDLSGRRVENPVSGLYIVNGKKVFINKK